MIENEFMMVSVLCQTYNHEQYISECLQSIVAQKVNFRYEILVHDDASTDNTANIIRKFEREYPDLIKPIYQEVNQWSLGNKVFSGIQLPRCTGKYIAICEGDDYWTDPLKLQKQVDILEGNENIGLVYAKARVYLQSKCKYADDLFGEYRASLNEMIFKGKCDSNSHSHVSARNSGSIPTRIFSDKGVEDGGLSIMVVYFWEV